MPISTFGDWIAQSPEDVCRQLLPGSAAMMVAAGAAYAGIATALAAAAGESTGSIQALMQTGWRSDAATKANGAFTKHHAWMSQLADQAAAAAQRSYALAAAYTAAQTATLPVPGMLAHYYSTMATATVMSGAAALTPGLGLLAAGTYVAAEAEYAAIKAHTTATMTTYAGVALPNMVTPPVPTAPSIAAPGSGFTSNIVPTSYLTSIGGATADVVGKISQAANIASTVSNATSSASNTASTVSQAASSSTDTVSKAATDAASQASQASQAAQAGNPLSGLPTDGAGGNGTDGAGSSHEGLLGTSPTSSTLAGLSGGAGSTVAFGLARGGIGAMSGASTGFRLPTGWNAGSVINRGSPTSNILGAASEPVGSMAPQRAAPRGASAPTALRRRDERDPDKQKATSTQAIDAPLLGEEPLTVGVIEYLDDDEPPAEE